MENTLVTISELEKQILTVEGIKVSIKPKENTQPTRLVRPYNYNRLPDTATVNDLKERINKCVEPFIYILNF